MTDYIVLLLVDTEAWWDTPDDEKKAAYAAHARFSEELERRGHTIVGGAELPRASEAKSLAPYSDTVTDGPWTETAEQVGGYYEVSTEDLDDLMDACKILSATGDAVEVHRKITGEDAS